MNKDMNNLPLELQVYSTKEVAEILRVHYKAVLQWIKAGKLKATRVGRDFKITGAEIKRVLDEGI